MIAYMFIDFSTDSTRRQFVNSSILIVRVNDLASCL